MPTHRFAAFTAALALLLATAIIPTPAKAQQTLTLLESTPGFFDLPLRNAIADFAPALHLDIKVVTINGGGALTTEFQGGTGDLAMVGADTPLRLAQANAVPGGVTILGTNMTNMLYALVSKAGSPYKSLESLKGQSIAVTGAGAASEVVLKWALKTKAHMPFTDVHIVALGSPPTILQGVIRGSVAAGTVFSPALDEGLSSGAVQIAFDFRQYQYAQNVFMARTEQVKKNPTPYKLFMQAYNQAVQKMYADPDYTLKTALKYWGQGTTEQVVKSELDFYMKSEWKETRFTKGLYDACKDVLLSSGAFPTSNFPSYESLTQDAPQP